jgi:peptidoglycan/xylan/chitin deacetylase (PgdA/CDA1 family)
LILKGKLKKTNEIIKKITGLETKIFRSPFGFLPFWIKNYLLKRNYQIVMWDLDSKDWERKLIPKFSKKLNQVQFYFFTTVILQV